MINYLKKYKIETAVDTVPSVELDKDHYQIIKADGFFFYIDKQSDIVIRFNAFKPYAGDNIPLAVMKKNQIVCEYFHPVKIGLKFRAYNQQWLEHMVFLAQTSFYFLLEKRERQDVVNFLNKNAGCHIRVQTLNNSITATPLYVFVSMDIYNLKSLDSQRIDIHASVNTKANHRLMSSYDSAFLSDNVTAKLVKRYTIKRMEHFHSLNKDFHYYEVTLAGDYFGRVMIHYDMNKKKATFSLLTYVHGEPVVKKRHILIEPDSNFQINILQTLEKLYLGKYPSPALINHFKDWHTDISNGLGEDHLTVLEMFEI